MSTELQHLLALFPPQDYLQAYEVVPGPDVPEPYQGLLVHEYHMTVTVEAYHGSLVDVKVLDEKLLDHFYARQILLTLQGSGKVVQFGLMRIDLSYCRPKVRDEILARKTPLGRILIKHNVLRRIEPTAYLRVTPGPEMIKWFALAGPRTTFGRTAVIHCDDQPAVEVLEIVAPEEA